MKKTITVLYVHGFNGSGSGTTATRISKLLPNDGRINFITHNFSNKVEDIPKNIDTINELVSLHHPEIIIASSLGGFETMHAVSGPYKLLINPTFNPSINLPKLVEVSEETIQDIKALGAPKFDEEDKYVVYGFFGDQDEVCNYQKEFREIFGNKAMCILHDGHQLKEENLKVVVDKAVEIADFIVLDYERYLEERKLAEENDNEWT